MDVHGVVLHPRDSTAAIVDPHGFVDRRTTQAKHAHQLSDQTDPGTLRAGTNYRTAQAHDTKIRHVILFGLAASQFRVGTSLDKHGGNVELETDTVVKQRRREITHTRIDLDRVVTFEGLNFGHALPFSGTGVVKADRLGDVIQGHSGISRIRFLKC